MKERRGGRRLRALKSWTLNECGTVLVRSHARGKMLSCTWRGSAVIERILMLRKVTGRTGKPAARNAKGHGAPGGPAPSSTSFPWSLGNCSIKCQNETRRELSFNKIILLLVNKSFGCRTSPQGNLSKEKLSVIKNKLVKRMAAKYKSLLSKPLPLKALLNNPS